MFSGFYKYVGLLNNILIDNLNKYNILCGLRKIFGAARRRTRQPSGLWKFFGTALRTRQPSGLWKIQEVRLQDLVIFIPEHGNCGLRKKNYWDSAFGRKVCTFLRCSQNTGTVWTLKKFDKCPCERARYIFFFYFLEHGNRSDFENKSDPEFQNTATGTLKNLKGSFPEHGNEPDFKKNWKEECMRSIQIFLSKAESQ